MPINTFPIATVPPTASLISNTPSPPISATNVQTAINQLAGMVGGPATVPGGANLNVQYNNAGVFGGLTDTQLTARVAPFSSILSGAVPASGGGTSNFLRADGTFAVPPGGGGGGLTDGDKGDITVTGGGLTWTIDPAVVTYAKIQNVSATNRFLGRIAVGAGPVQELTGTQAATLLAQINNSALAAMPANTIKGNNTGGLNIPADLTGLQAEGVLQFQNTGTGASTVTLDSRLKREVYVTDFGADNTGVADAHTQIQNAINSLGAGGGDVIFPYGKYKLNSGLMIGNGSISANSTRRGVRLIGMGMPSWPTGGNVYGSLPASVQLDYGGGADASMAMINVLGPLSGWGVENMYISGNVLCGAGINVFGANNGVVRNITMTGFIVGGLMSRPLMPLTGGGYAACSRNLYEHIIIEVPNYTDAKGVWLGCDGTPTITDDTYYNTFIDVEVELVASVNQTYCFYLGVCDTNTFINCTAQSLGGIGAIGYAFDYNNGGSAGVYPNGNCFFACDCAGFAGVGQQILTTGTFTNGQAVNHFIGSGLSNGQNTIAASGVIAYDPRAIGTVPLTVAQLPGSTAFNKGYRAFVSNSNATLAAGLGNVVAGGGGNNVPVYCDGTNWRIG